MNISSPEEEAIRQKWLNEDVAWENAQIEVAMREQDMREQTNEQGREIVRQMNARSGAT